MKKVIKERGTGALKRYKKKELLEAVSMLIKVNDDIVRDIKTNPGSIRETLKSCQESAILIGTYIESLDGKYADLVKLLEEYCENIFQLNEAVTSEIQCRKTVKKIQKQLNEIKHGITYDLPEDRKEVVFLPYKASMWDSLESVWKAADADGNTDVYVIPIPYFSRNPDGSFREMYYERDLYPDYVPITKYDEYDFETRKPDEIYIHNGYDSCNIVTSVHPYFYSENLKKFTDCLVYIPYFVLAEPDPNDKDIVKNIGHFCTVSAVFHADRVIVQSEAMKQVYIKALMDTTNDHSSAAKKYWDDKIAGTGSPKLEKVVDTRRDDVEIPKEWLRIINKPNGTLKKIILYNNSIGALLQHNEDMIVKMKAVFEVFKQRRDEIALLWRPHPLIENTLTSMCPQLWEAYQAIRDEYIAEGWGIYDDTPDIDRAIVVSDAYYGDGSSVVQLCEEVKKPIMIQNVEAMEYKRYDRRLRFIDFLDAGETIWFCGLYANGLFKFHKPTGKTKLACILPTSTVHESYRAICQKDEKLYIAPVFADSIVIFDIARRHLKELTLEEQSNLYRRMPLDGQANFLQMHIFDKYVFFVPLSFGAIVRLDTETDKLEYFDDFVKLLLPVVNKQDAFWFGGSCVVNEKLYLASSCANALIVFDLRSCTSILYKLGEEAVRYLKICYDGKNFWISDSPNSCVVVWNEQDGIVDRIQLCAPNMYPYHYIFELNGFIWLVSCCGNLTCTLINKSDHAVSEIRLQVEKSALWSVSEIFKRNDAVLSLRIEDKKILVYSTQRDSLCVFDQMGQCLSEHFFEICAEDGDDFMEMQRERFGQLAKRENGTIFLTEDFYEMNMPAFLNYMANTNLRSDEESILQKNYGNPIYKNERRKH